MIRSFFAVSDVFFSVCLKVAFIFRRFPLLFVRGSCVAVGRLRAARIFLPPTMNRRSLSLVRIVKSSSILCRVLRPGRFRAASGWVPQATLLFSHGNPPPFSTSLFCRSAAPFGCGDASPSLSGSFQSTILELFQAIRPPLSCFSFVVSRHVFFFFCCILNILEVSVRHHLSCPYGFVFDWPICAYFFQSCGLAFRRGVGLNECLPGSPVSVLVLLGTDGR